MHDSGVDSMSLIDEDVRLGCARRGAMDCLQPRAAAARYDRKGRRIQILLTNGLELSVPVKLARGLAGKTAADLEHIEISPAGLTLHWPRLAADLYLPSLLSDVFGSRERRWQAYWAGWDER